MGPASIASWQLGPSTSQTLCTLVKEMKPDVGVQAGRPTLPRDMGKACVSVAADARGGGDVWAEATLRCADALLRRRPGWAIAMRTRHRDPRAPLDAYRGCMQRMSVRRHRDLLGDLGRRAGGAREGCRRVSRGPRESVACTPARGRARSNGSGPCASQLARRARCGVRGGQ